MQLDCNSLDVLDIPLALLDPVKWRWAWQNTAFTTLESRLSESGCSLLAAVREQLYPQVQAGAHALAARLAFTLPGQPELSLDLKAEWTETDAGGRYLLSLREHSSNTNPAFRTKLLEAALEQTADSILVTDNLLDPPGPHIVYANQAFLELTGYTWQELKGRNPRMFQGPKTNPKALRHMRKSLEQGKSCRVHALNYRKDGTPYYLYWTIAPLRNEQGEITHWVANQRDVTRMVLRRRRRLRKAHNLQERIVDLKERMRNRFASQLHDSLGQVLSLIRLQTHHAYNKLRNPNGQDIPDTREAARLLEQVVALTDEAIQEIRDFSHQQSSLPVEVFGLEQALEQLAARVRKHAAINVYLAVDANTKPYRKALQVALYRIAQELVGNSLRHAQPANIWLELQTNENGILLALHDDGKGFDDTRMGTGLGASNILNRVDLYAGYFTQESQPGAGASFEVFIPLGPKVLRPMDEQDQDERNHEGQDQDERDYAEKPQQQSGKS